MDRRELGLADVVERRVRAANAVNTINDCMSLDGVGRMGDVMLHLEISPNVREPSFRERTWLLINLEEIGRQADTLH